MDGCPGSTGCHLLKNILYPPLLVLRRHLSLLEILNKQKSGGLNQMEAEEGIGGEQRRSGTEEKSRSEHGAGRRHLCSGKSGLRRPAAALTFCLVHFAHKFSLV